ncbi:MAG: glycosyltransferase family 2 protein [Gammaproteobacteria bacterium]|nr:glycosyltransferase family 2 protein [Gammaproteobacteria bacterium]
MHPGFVFKGLFWLGVATVVYVYLIYPLLVWLLASLRSEHTAPGLAAHPPARRLSIVLAVHDEAARIRARLDELVELLATVPGAAELIVVADGCADGTAALARSHPSPLVRVIELPDNQGKAQALSRACAAAQGEIVVFADARQRWAADALQRLLENFARPEIGAVSGALVLEAPAGVLAGVGLYWRYEKWLRRNEGRLHSTVGVSGSICAVRRELFRPIPRGVLLDDLYWPLLVVMQGRRVVYDERALAYDRLPGDPAHEFRRKVRTLTGNLQLAASLPQSLLPWRNPIWVQFISHKLLRLLVPWALIAVLISSALLDGWFYRAALGAQLLFYGAALLALAGALPARSRLAAAAASFVVLNAAAWLAWWVWLCGRAQGTWKKVTYDAPLSPD